MPDILETLSSRLAVDRDPAALARYIPETCGPRDARPLAAVRPTDFSQVQDLVVWANGSRCPLVPVSSPAGPRRRGATSLSRPAVVVDLSGMNRILHVDGRDSIAVIEPGVTFPQFDAALKGHGLRAFKPLLPRRTKSVLASYLDREPTTSPHDHWDSEDPVGGMQVVFGNGEAFRTGTAAVKGNLDEQLRKGSRQMMALGPGSTDFLRVVQGSQGTFAIAAWASAYCEPIPALEKALFAGADIVAPLVELAYRVLWRRQGGQLFILNRTQLAMILAADAGAFETIAAQLPAWILYVNLTAPDYLPEERIAYLEADLRDDAAAFGLAVTPQLAGHSADEIGSLQGDLPVVPYRNRLLGASRDVFFLTQLDKASRFIDALDALRRERPPAQAPVGVYLQPRVQGVSCHFEATFPFDPADKDAAGAAQAFADLAARRFAEIGAFFSRPYGTWSAIAFEKDRSIKPYLAAAKEMFDPNAILSPGRLCF